MENSERGRWVTEWVSVWIVNDGEFYPKAREFAEAGQIIRMKYYVLPVLKYSAQQAPRAVRAELAPNDWAPIDWGRIAEDLVGE